MNQENLKRHTEWLLIRSAVIEILLAGYSITVSAGDRVFVNRENSQHAVMTAILDADNGTHICLTAYANDTEIGYMLLMPGYGIHRAIDVAATAQLHQFLYGTLQLATRLSWQYPWLAEGE